jgi:hypothetical protein
VHHQLAAAIRFEDAFTAMPPEAVLDAQVDVLPVVPNMPGLPWRAIRAADGTHRFLVSQNTAMPVGPLTVTVGEPDDIYKNYEPFVITLPLPIAGSLPTRQDFIVRRVVWPTRRLRLQPGETGVIGSIVNAGGAPVAGLRVRIAEAPLPIAPSVPYTYSDTDGSFLVRLPGLRSMTGSPPVGTPRTTVSIVIELLTSAAIPVLPTSPPFPALLALGLVNSLLITVP